jgi:hypothetical protein
MVIFFVLLHSFLPAKRCKLIYILKKNRVGSQPGLPGSPGFRVDWVSPDQLPGEFLLRPGPVPGPGRSAGPVRVSKLCLKNNLLDYFFNFYSQLLHSFLLFTNPVILFLYTLILYWCQDIKVQLYTQNN